MVHVKHRTRGAPKIVMRGEPRFKSRRGLRRTQRKTPGSITVVHYEKKKAGKPLCAICKNYLHGIPRAKPIVMSHMSRTEKTVQRPFGANLCSPCTRKVLVWKARVKHKIAKADDVPIHYREFVKV